MFSLAIIQYLLLFSLKLVDSTGGPATEKVKGDPRNPRLKVTGYAYVANNTRFERTCIIDGGAYGPQQMKFYADDGMEIKSKPPRVSISINTDNVTNITTGMFVLDTANDDDNTYKTITCRNTDAKISAQFGLYVIPDISIPSIVVNNGARTLRVKKGASTKLKCSLSAKASGIVKQYSLGWVAGNIMDKVKCSREKQTTSEYTVSKADLLTKRKYYCVACLMFKSSATFDVVRKYYASIDVGVQIESTTEELTRYKGDNVQFDCGAIQSPRPVAKWWKKEWSKDEVLLPSNNIDKVDKRYSYNVSTSKTTAKQISALNSVFQISDITFADRSQYICRVEYSDQNVTRIFTLRVRDPLGVVWPIIGMVVEAILLVLIVVWVEQQKDRKRKKKERRNDTADAAMEPLVNSDHNKVTSNNEVLT